MAVMGKRSGWQKREERREIAAEPAAPPVSPSVPAPATGSGRLLVVATPIGNLADITPRAAEALRDADIIAAEDTRRTRRLLAHLALGKRLISYRAHNQSRQAAGLIKLMREGKTLALVTDAGTPAISDPGFLLVREAAAAGIAVGAIPGPCALVTALSVSGFPSDRFVFEGFLPQKKGRRGRIEELAAEHRTVALYESPHRILSLLETLAELCPERQVVVARELTKLFEELIRGTCAEVNERLRGIPPRGEYTVILGPRPSRRNSDGGEDEPHLEGPHFP
jgi:16S rRNA (cytidine1402-2'-O)-methyltransferase